MLGLVCWVMLSSDPPSRDLLAQIDALGALRVATLNGPLTLYNTADGYAGFEHDLVTGFARAQGLEVDWKVYASLDAAIDAVRLGNAHLLAAAWTPADVALTSSPPALLVSQPYRQAQYQVVVHQELRPRPPTLLNLTNRRLMYAQPALVHALAEAAPALAVELAERSHEQLLEQVALREIDAAVVDSDSLFIARRGFPELREGPLIGAPLDKVWAFPAPQGDVLRERVDRYFAQLQEAGSLATLVDRHFEHLDRLDAYSRNAFRERVESRLPAFRELLESAAQRHGLDWRFLAAVAYQESQWDPDAVSVTGVRGLMMLTQRTAREVGVRDRKDPRESIDGGAQYFVNLHARVSPEAPEPDRTWMTLAAYNLGFGHLLDLQRLTAHLGGDPLRWTDLRSHLLKLSQPRWYRHEVVRYGYARGAEARSYVANIRAYYDLLRWRFPAPGESALDVEQPIAPFRLELPPVDESQRPDTLLPVL